MRRPLAITCTTFVALAAGGCIAGRPEVEQLGAMQDVMRNGHTEGRARLVDVVARPHAIGVGALEGLAGEITIVGGEVWVARVDDGDLQVTGPVPAEGDRATLLTLAHVARWQSVAIDRRMEGLDLESFIEQAAAAHGIDVTAPFPFIIEGAVDAIDLHVVNGYCPIAIDPATMEARPWRLSNARSTDVLVAGFFAADSGGVMTHHGSSIHAHAVMSIDGRTITGHVDRIAVAPGMTLRLPKLD